MNIFKALFSWIASIFKPKQGSETSVAPPQKGPVIGAGSLETITWSVGLKGPSGWTKTVSLPAKGNFCTESHYVTDGVSFKTSTGWPSTQTDGMNSHLEESTKVLQQYFPGLTKDQVYKQSWMTKWTPAEGGGNIGQGSISRKPSILEEMFQGNMMFASGQKPSPGTRFLVTNEANGKKCVIQMGFETGPGAEKYLGGLTTEVHFVLGSDDSTVLTLEKLKDESAQLGLVVEPLGSFPNVEIEEPDRPDISAPNQKLLWCPFAKKLDYSMKTQGMYRRGYPEGAVVHFTAGQCDTEQDMLDTMSWGRGEGYAFFGIGPTGVIYQAHPLDKWGHHAGTSSWPGLGSSLSQYLVGIEVASAGLLDAKGKSWFGKTYPSSRYREADFNTHGFTGKFLAFTKEQEDSLTSLLKWLKSNNPGVFKNELVLGHHEVSPGRKNDPGGALSIGMKGLRGLL